MAQNFAPPADAETLNDILWYPSLYNPLIIKRWSDVPYLTDGEISTDNTSEQVKQGLGDPCKLAGLSETQIRDMGIIDNGQWHMATPEEYNHIIAASNNETSSYGYFFVPLAAIASQPIQRRIRCVVWKQYYRMLLG